jgi:ClpP class serine protease
MPNWAEVLRETQEEEANAARQKAMAATNVRKRYLTRLHSITKRNTISYYSAFLSKQFPGLELNDEDKNGFMTTVHQLDRTKGLDLILHTPGGMISSTQSIVHYLREMFQDDIRAIVPQIAMSAGTMLACSCREILMGKHSNLGPIDPHLRNIPAYGVLQEFKRACKEVKKDPSRASIWSAIIGQYRPTFLTQCENSIKWSNAFVQEQLEQVMFRGEANAQQTARSIVRKLADFGGNKTHDKHIHSEEAKRIGLRIVPLEANPDLQDAVLTVHHCYMGMLMNTSAGKIIENQNGVAMIKMIDA